jgi:hypothetical protein
MSRSTPLPVRTLDEVRDAYPAWRQSTLATADSCLLMARWDLEGVGYDNAAMVRGTLFHRFAGEVLRTLWRTGEVSMPTEEAIAILYEVVAQRDVPDAEVLWLPAVERRYLRKCAISLVYDYENRRPREFNMRNMLAVEERLTTPLFYPDPDGGIVERTLSGQPDAIIGDPPDGLVILDWKTTRQPPAKGPEPDSERGDHHDDAEHVSYLGYFQQRSYGLLALKRWPHVERVTLREFYPLAGEARWATIYRRDMEHVERELTTLVEIMDRAMMGGHKSPMWKPSPGKHCLSGETRFLTERGAMTLREACDRRVRVLNRFGKWEDATVRSFGVQPLLRVTFDDGSIVRATPDHRWWQLARRRDRDGWEQTAERITTAELERAPLTPPPVMGRLNHEGVRHGFTFGDGWRRNDRGTCVARFMPQDADVAEFFGRVRWRESGQGYAYGLPGHYKDLPVNPTPRYARGFVAGLFAADGTVGKAGDTTIACEGAERAERIAELARQGGCSVTSVRLSSDKPTAYSPVGTVTRELMVVRIKPGTVPVLRSDHRARLKPRNQMRRMYREVVSIEPDGMEEVFCAVVPGSESFTLANGIATSNCAYCPRPTHCPIEVDVRAFATSGAGGGVASAQHAAKLAGEYVVAKSVASVLHKALSAYADVHGPLDVKSAKGRMQLRWKRNKGGGRQFGMHVPDDSDKGPADASLEAAFSEAAARAKAAV